MLKVLLGDSPKNSSTKSYKPAFAVIQFYQSSKKNIPLLDRIILVYAMK